MFRLTHTVLLALSLAPAVRSAGVTDATIVHGMTVSCESWGFEWGTDAFCGELDQLAHLGVNWVAIHPYASIRADGTVEARALDPEHPPEWIARPIREAHARGMSILVIPHIAYWGSPWSWRGAIEFADAAALQRFFDTYTAWITSVAACAPAADGFSIGNETDKLVGHEREWRALIASVRKSTRAKLTYAAHWSEYEKVPFWDALDAVGIQAYFPLADSCDPSDAELRESWRLVCGRLERLHERTGKPIVFTELGYNCSIDAAKQPWAFASAHGGDIPRAEALQTRLLRVALEEIGARSSWLRGAFLWKWFVGDEHHANFRMQAPAMRAVIGAEWGAHAAAETKRTAETVPAEKSR